jgi:hypothetical protein
MRRNLSPNILRVSASPIPGCYSSISKAVHDASEGDQIIVEDGIYSMSRTEERFPIYVPPRCQLIGTGEKCFIDGSNTKEIFDRPLDPNQSLVILGDETAISGFNVCNSRANGISNEQGARFLVTQNVIEGNGQHGLLVFATNGALVHENRFVNNGASKTNITVPRSSVPAKQGHHVYIESRIGCTNDVTITGNKMQAVHADAIANDVIDQPSGVSMRIQVVGNTISDCGRNGLSIAGSYSANETFVFIDVRNNKILNTNGNAIDLLSAYSLTLRSISDAKLFVNIVGNTIDGCDCGINTICSYDSTNGRSELSCNILRNEITNATRFGVRVIGGLSYDGWAAENSSFNLTVSDNSIGMTRKEPIFVQGGIALKTIKNGPDLVRGNQVFAHIVENKDKSSGKLLDQKAIIVNDGYPTNVVSVASGSQLHTVINQLVEYSEP